MLAAAKQPNEWPSDVRLSLVEIAIVANGEQQSLHTTVTIICLGIDITITMAIPSQGRMRMPMPRFAATRDTPHTHNLTPLFRMVGTSA